MQIMLAIYLNSSTCIYLSLDNGVTMTSKCRDNKNLVSFICFSFLIRFTMEKEIDHVLPFLDVLIDNSHRGSVVTSTFRKKTFTGLFTNYLSFAPLSYKIDLIRTLIDRVFKISNTWLGFQKDNVKLVFILRKILFPVHLKDKCVYRYLSTAIDRTGSTQNTSSQAGVNNTFISYLILTVFLL